MSADISIEGILDSKVMKEADREAAFAAICAHPGVRYGMCASDCIRNMPRRSDPTQGVLRATAAVCRSIVDAAEIDRVNILQATFRAMERAVLQIPGAAVDAALIDGPHAPPGVTARHVQPIVKGDGKCFSIGAASILAKVTRDRLMVEAHAKWPQYGFAQHKGYGTKAHMAAVRAHGPCPIHRLTFRPLPEIVAKLAEQENVQALAQRADARPQSADPSSRAGRRASNT